MEANFLWGETVNTPGPLIVHPFLVRISQIEALLFPTAGSTSSGSDANMSSPDAEITIKADLVKSMNASLPTYDLNTLFSGVQDSGGEAMMTFTGTLISRFF